MADSLLSRLKTRWQNAFKHHYNVVTPRKSLDGLAAGEQASDMSDQRGKYRHRKRPQKSSKGRLARLNDWFYENGPALHSWAYYPVSKITNPTEVHEQRKGLTLLSTEQNEKKSVREPIRPSEKPFVFGTWLVTSPVGIAVALSDKLLQFVGGVLLGTLEVAAFDLVLNAKNWVSDNTGKDSSKTGKAKQIGRWAALIAATLLAGPIGAVAKTGRILTEIFVSPLKMQEKALKFKWPSGENTKPKLYNYLLAAGMWVLWAGMIGALIYVAGPKIAGQGLLNVPDFLSAAKGLIGKVVSAISLQAVTTIVGAALLAIYRHVFPPKVTLTAEAAPAAIPVPPLGLGGDRLLAAGSTVTVPVPAPASRSVAAAGPANASTAPSAPARPSTTASAPSAPPARRSAATATASSASPASSSATATAVSSVRPTTPGSQSGNSTGVPRRDSAVEKTRAIVQMARRMSQSGSRSNSVTSGSKGTTPSAGSKARQPSPGNQSSSGSSHGQPQGTSPSVSSVFFPEGVVGATGAVAPTTASSKNNPLTPTGLGASAPTVAANVPSQPLNGAESLKDLIAANEGETESVAPQGGVERVDSVVSNGSNASTATVVAGPSADTAPSEVTLLAPSAEDDEAEVAVVEADKGDSAKKQQRRPSPHPNVLNKGGPGAAKSGNGQHKRTESSVSGSANASTVSQLPASTLTLGQTPAQFAAAAAFFNSPQPPLSSSAGRPGSEKDTVGTPSKEPKPKVNADAVSVASSSASGLTTSSAAPTSAAASSSGGNNAPPSAAALKFSPAAPTPNVQADDSVSSSGSPLDADASRLFPGGTGTPAPRGGRRGRGRGRGSQQQQPPAAASSAGRESPTPKI